MSLESRSGSVLCNLWLKNVYWETVQQKVALIDVLGLPGLQLKIQRTYLSQHHICRQLKLKCKFMNEKSAAKKICSGRAQ
jgi:hypothetical protein